MSPLRYHAVSPVSPESMADTDAKDHAVSPANMNNMDKKDAAAAHAPEVDYQYSTLEVVEDHPDAKKFAYAQQVNGLHPDPHSTLESHKNPDRAYTSEKIAMDPRVEEEEEEEKAEEKKGNWKRRRVLGVPLLFLVIGGVLVVVVAAVVGGVVGSKGKSQDDANAFSATGGTRPSDEYFSDSVLYALETEIDGKEVRLEGPQAHGQDPEDGIFLGEFLPDDKAQRWDVKFLESNLLTQAVSEGKTLFYLRLNGTNLAAQIDDPIWDSINHGSKPDAGRRNVPLVLRDFNKEEKNQMWYYGAPDKVRRRDRIFNHGILNTSWTMGIGFDSAAAMVLEQRPEDQLVWRLHNFTRLPWVTT